MPSKIRLLQCYVVLWIHVIDAICSYWIFLKLVTLYQHTTTSTKENNNIKTLNTGKSFITKKLISVIWKEVCLQKNFPKIRVLTFYITKYSDPLHSWSDKGQKVRPNESFWVSINRRKDRRLRLGRQNQDKPRFEPISWLH